MVSRSLLPVVVTGLWANAALAQDPSVRATVTPNPVGVNSQFVVNVQVNGVQQLDEGPNLPDLDFADLLGSGTSTNLQIINGRTTVSQTIQYRFITTREGSFTIPPITLTAAGQSLATDPIQITVSQSAASTVVTSDGTTVEIPEGAIYVEAIPSRSRVYVNEPVIVDYRLYTELPVSRYSITDGGASVGFWVEDLETPGSPQVENVEIDGRTYATALIGRKAFFPTGAGERTIQPLAVEANIRYERRSGRNSLFSRGLFAERVPLVLNTESIDVEVLPAPATGRPSDFSGFVGDLDVSASVDRANAQTNEAITLTVRVSGTGNLQTLAAPEIDFTDDFEVYPPETSENIDRSGSNVRGSRVYEYVLIPRVPGTHTIPAIGYSYLNSATGRYARAEDGPIGLTVTGDADDAPMIARGGGRGSVTNLREDIRFIHTTTPSFRRKDRSLLETAGFWIVLLLPLSLVGGAVGLRKHQDSLQRDASGARRRYASKAARKRLDSARKLVDPESRKEFHSEVARALRGFLADKLGVSEAGMVLERVASELDSRGVSNDVIEPYFREIEHCEHYRFAPVEVAATEMQDLLSRAERVMTDMERAL